MGGSWGQEVPFPRETGNTRVSSEQDRVGWVEQLIFEPLRGARVRGQGDPALARGPGQLPGAHGARTAFSLEKPPVGSSRDPVDGGKQHCGSCWGGGSGTAWDHPCWQTGLRYKALRCAASAGGWRRGQIAENRFTHGLASQSAFWAPDLPVSCINASWFLDNT